MNKQSSRISMDGRELSDQDVKTVMVTIFHMFKNVRYRLERFLKDPNQTFKDEKCNA